MRGVTTRRLSSNQAGQPDMIAVLVVTGLVLAFFWKMTFTNLILPRGDAFTYFYPYWAYRNTALRAGSLPLWNPYLFMGAPFLANSQAGVFYPLNWPLIWLDAPTAVKAAIVIHIALAAIGAYVFARRTLSLSALGSTLAGVVFALGGYLTAQVEHINQLQGLAWLPWLFWLWSETAGGRRKAVLWLALVLTMQLLAGHTQTAFISGVGLGVWVIWHTIGRWRENRSQLTTHKLISAAWPLGALVLATLLAAGLAATQLLPTLELTRLSNRSGGLPFREALSFSLRPQLIGRGLLPSYADEPLFSEFVATIGIVALLLALLGAWRTRHNKQVLGLTILTGVGIFLALGAYNPVYWGLVRFVPGFDLFRAPARWMALWGLGMAGLAGVGLDSLTPRPSSQADPEAENLPDRSSALSLLWLPVIVAALAGLSFLAPLEANEIPGATQPGLLELSVWVVMLLLGMGLIWWALHGEKATQTNAPWMLVGLVIIELFLAGQNLPYNALSTPAAWSTQRPAISTLLAASEGVTPPPRFLSISDILFDPGDLLEIEAIFGPHLDDRALYDYVIATKQKEILAPNLPLAWGIPAMDGFDGGILPTRDYIQFTSLFLDEEAISPDGRLRENLSAVPPLEWLRMANVRWIITDKVYDVWIDGVYYDLQFPASATVPADTSSPPAIEAYPLLPFVATTVGIVGYIEDAGGLPDGAQIGTVAVFSDGNDLPLVQPLLVGDNLSEDSSGYSLVRWDAPMQIERVEVSVVTSFPGTLVVRGVSLIDERSGAFMPTSVSRGNALRLIQSGDVKIYEYRDARPRAYLVCDPVLVVDQEHAWDALAESPAQTVIQGGLERQAQCDSDDPGEAAITSYEAERVEITTRTREEGVWLVLADAWYPGWEATIDGESVDIHRANGTFRALLIPAGTHEVVFAYHSRQLVVGGVVSMVCLIGVVAGLVVRWPGRRSTDSPATP